MTTHTKRERKSKPTARGIIRCNCYAVLERAVEDGLAHGVRRAYKHSEEQISDAQMLAVVDNCEQSVMTAICEVFRFED